MKRITLRETRSPYNTLTVDENVLREPVVLERDGRSVAVLVPIAEYKVFRVWQQAQDRCRLTAPAEAFEQEKAAFERIKSELLRTHRGQVVAIHQGRIVQTGTDIPETLEAVYDQFGYVPCYVQRVEEMSRVCKFPHRKVVR